MARPVFDGDGELTGFTGIDRDITQRREAEEALRKAHLELISARENERRVLAKELHDSVAQDLVVLQLMVSGLRKGGEGQDASAQQISEKLGEAITEIRRICHGLYPPMLESLGLGHALVYLSELYCSAERNVSCECEEAVMTERFSPEVEITLYRIAQEATSNAIRHGKARNVILRLHTANELVHLEVQDDGQGFEPGGGVNKLGLGLQSMKDRATSVDGSLAIESQTGRTVVSASVPAEDSVGEL
jgi:signal transduction histidine kinase